MISKLLASVLLLSPLTGLTQSVKQITNDEYTKVWRTSWEPILRGLSSEMVVHVQCSKINSDLELGFKMLLIEGAIDEGAALQFTLENDSVVTLYNTQFTLPCVGCGATNFYGSASLGFYLRFPISPRAANDLSSQKIKKMRIYMQQGYYDRDIKTKYADIIKKELWLLQ